jgi:hypothetical protein
MRYAWVVSKLRLPVIGSISGKLRWRLGAN